MGKNNTLINAYKSMGKKLKTQIDQITPEVYAGIALALHRKHGWGYKRINDLFNLSGEIWNECVQSDLNMIEMCEEETGLKVINVVSGSDLNGY